MYEKKEEVIFLRKLIYDTRNKTFIFFSFSAKSIKVCSRNEPKLSECIISSVKELQPRLASGKLDDDFIVPVG
jgi:hypothetical protein